MSTPQPPSARPRRTVPWMVLAALAVAGLALVHVHVRLRVVDLGYQVARERAALGELEHARRQLHAEVAWLQTPARLEEIARRRLGLSAPDGTQVHLVRPPQVAGR